MKLDATYRAGLDGPPRAGTRAPARGADRLAVLDDLGREVVSVLAPPLVPAEAADRYEGVAQRRPGLDLVIEWHIRRWPRHDRGDWVQVFRDGVERDELSTIAEDGRRDLIIACDYRDFARFLIGDGPLTNCGAPIRIERGGVTEMSCLHGLVLDEGALRAVAYTDEVRRLLAIGIAKL